MIDVHCPANLFYPELPGGCLQYLRYGPFLRERGVRLRIHTARKPHHESAEIDIQGISVRRYDVPADFSNLAELEFLTGRALVAIGNNRERACLHPLGTTEASFGSVRRLWKARMRGIPLCFHFMMVPIKEHQRFPGNLKEALRTRVILSPYQKLLMCSHVMGRAFETVAGVSPQRIEVIPNGIDLSVFSPVTTAKKLYIRRSLGLPEEDPVVLYVGSVIARKGIELLIEAWGRVIERHPRARLVIVGSTRPRPTLHDAGARLKSEEFFDRISNEVDSLKNPESVIFAGEVDNIRDYYRASDLFAFASRREGLPSVVLEAMACGIPCVLAPFIGLPADGEEYGVDGEHFIKTTFDPSRMADDIIRLIESEETRGRIGTKASEWICNTQEMGKAADRLASVYRDMTLSD